MMKPATAALVFFALAAGDANATSPDGHAVPLFPKLTWGQSKEAALSSGLRTYAKTDKKADVIGLPSITVGGIDFSVQVVFDKKDVSTVQTGLNYIVLEHEGYVAKSKYEKFMRSIKSDFIYDGKTSNVGYSASFYNALNKSGHLTIMNANANKLSLAIAPGAAR